MDRKKNVDGLPEIVNAFQANMLKQLESEEHETETGIRV